MPTANESYCQLKIGSDYDRVRREANDTPVEEQVIVNGRRVIRVYGFNEDDTGGDLIGYAYRRRDKWDEHEASARSHCEQRDGRFEPMPDEDTTAAVKVAFEDEGPAQSLVPIVAATEDGEHTPKDGWYPVIPLGKFVHQVSGEFEVTHEDAEEFVANFNAGLPWGEAGVPIDEDGFHEKQKEAFGWIEQLQVRANAIYGYISFSDLGREAVAANRYRYVSPRFYPRGRVFDKNSGEATDNIITAAALTNSPFFSGQPGLFDCIAAHIGIETETTQDSEDSVTASDEGADADDDDPNKQSSTTGAQAPPEVTHQMDEQKAREQYEAIHGKVSDDEWSELTAEVEDWQAFVDGIEEPADEEPAEDVEPEEDVEDEETISISREDLEKLKEKAGLATDAAERAEKAEKQMEEVAASVHELQVSNRRLEVEGEVTASAYGGRKPAPGAVQAIVDLRMNPSEETVEAFLGHLDENDGSIALYQPGETEAVTADAGLNEDEVWLDGLNIRESTKDEIRAVADEEDCGFMAAYDKVLDSR